MTFAMRSLGPTPCRVWRLSMLCVGLAQLISAGCFLGEQVTQTRTWDTEPVRWSLDGQRITVDQTTRRDVNFGDTTFDITVWEAEPGDFAGRSVVHSFDREAIVPFGTVPRAGAFLFPALGESEYLLNGTSPPKRYWRDGRIDDYPMPAPWLNEDCWLARVIPRPDGLQHGLTIRCEVEDADPYTVMVVVDASDPSTVLNSSSLGASDQVQIFWLPEGQLAAYPYADEPKTWFRLDEPGAVEIWGTPECFYPSTTTGTIGPQGQQLCVNADGTDLMDCTEDYSRIFVGPTSNNYQYWRVQPWGCPDGPTLMPG